MCDMVIFRTCVKIIEHLGIPKPSIENINDDLQEELIKLVEANKKVQLEAMGIAKDVDKWMALQKDSIYEVIESMVISNNLEYDFIRNFLDKAVQRNAGNTYFLAFSDKSFVSASGWIPDSSYDPTSKDWFIEAIDNDDFYISDLAIDARIGENTINLGKHFKFKIVKNMHNSVIFNILDIQVQSWISLILRFATLISIFIVCSSENEAEKINTFWNRHYFDLHGIERV